MAKKYTMTCKVCGGEHMGTVCTKFTSIRVIDPTPKPKAQAPLLLPAPKTSKPKKKAKKRGKKPCRTSKKTNTPVAANSGSAP